MSLRVRFRLTLEACVAASPTEPEPEASARATRHWDIKVNQLAIPPLTEPKINWLPFKDTFTIFAPNQHFDKGRVAKSIIDAVQASFRALRIMLVVSHAHSLASETVFETNGTNALCGNRQNSQLA